MREEYPGETPSVYKILTERRYLPPPSWHILWVNYGQNISFYRDGVPYSREWFEEIDRFLDGKSKYKTIKELYWACFEAQGYKKGAIHGNDRE